MQQIYQSARCHFKYLDLSSQLRRDIEKLRGQVSENMILHDFAFKLLFSARFWEHLKMFKRFNTMALPLVGQT